MIGIKAIASYIPQFKESNYKKMEQFGVDEDFINNKIGVINKPHISAEEKTSDMCVKSFKEMTKKIQLNPEDIDCLVVCTQNPDDCGLPHTSAIVHARLGCGDNVAAFDISLGCSGYVYSLSIVTSFMEKNKMSKGLLFTADPYSKIVDINDKNTALLFGDAASVTLLSHDSVYEIGDVLFGTRGSEYEALHCKDNKLFMNGRAVFNFSMTVVPQQIRKLLDSSGCTFDDIDLLVLHQGSKYIIDVMCQRLKLDARKVPNNLSEIGNTVSSSIPLILEEYIEVSEFNKILISGFGVGLSWASAILKRI